MFSNLTKISWRNLKKTKVFTTLNVLGLALGFAGFIGAYAYINKELSYDRWNANYEHIYKVGFDNLGKYSDQTAPSLAPTLKAEFPEIIHAGRKANYSFGNYPLFGKNTVYVKKTVMVDSAMAQILQVESKNGPLYRFKDQKEASLISEELAPLLFEQQDLSFEDPKELLTLSKPLNLKIQIYGIAKPRKKSLLNYDLLIVKEPEDERYTGNKQLNETFIQVNPATDIKSLSAKINSYYQKHYAQQEGLAHKNYSTGTIYLDPLKNLHLQPKHGSNSAYLTIWAIGILSIIILALAAANFTNMMMAQAEGRAKETALKKVFGSSRLLLAAQFLLEVLFQTLLAAIIAILFLVLSENILQQWFFQDELSTLINLNTILALTIAIIVTTLLAGIYPALSLSGYKLTTMLNGNMQQNPQRSIFRHTILTFQFIIAILFTTALFVINKQVDYMRHSDKGFEPEQIITFKGLGLYYDMKPDGSYHDFKQRLLQNQNIISVSSPTNIPGGTDVPPKKQFTYLNHKREADHIGIDLLYFQTLGIKTLEGKSSIPLQTLVDDSLNNYMVINEAAVKAMGLSQPIGTKVLGCDVNFTIIGVVANSKAYGFEHVVPPTYYSFKDECGPGRYKFSLMVKARLGKVQEVIDLVKTEWGKNPYAENDMPLDYDFMDQQYAQFHAQQEQLQSAFSGFTLLSVLIACLGLFSMSAYSLALKKRQMSIRKILGASVLQLFIHLNKTFLAIFGSACLIAFPLGYLMLNYWLTNFAYRISLSLWYFLLATLLIFILIILTVSFQSLKTAKENPVHALRQE